MRKKLTCLFGGLIILLLILVPMGLGYYLGWLGDKTVRQEQEIKTEETIMNWRISAQKHEMLYREQLKINEHLVDENIRLRVNQDVLVLRLQKYEWVDKSNYK